MTQNLEDCEIDLVNKINLIPYKEYFREELGSKRLFLRYMDSEDREFSVKTKALRKTLKHKMNFDPDEPRTTTEFNRKIQESREHGEAGDNSILARVLNIEDQLERKRAELAQKQQMLSLQRASARSGSQQAPSRKTRGKKQGGSAPDGLRTDLEFTVSLDPDKKKKKKKKKGKIVPKIKSLKKELEAAKRRKKAIEDAKKGKGNVDKMLYKEVKKKIDGERVKTEVGRIRKSIRTREREKRKKRENWIRRMKMEEQRKNKKKTKRSNNKREK